ncbi:MAG TPA: restriction endonuclease subunit S [Candidatus Saccharimonadales bacterium]
MGTLGNSVIVDDDTPPAIFSSKSTVFRSASLNSYYLIAYLHTKYGRGFLERSVRGAVQTGLNLDDLKNLPIFIPDIEQQKAIATIVLKSRQTLEGSKKYYAQAEQSLLSELRLDEKDFTNELSYGPVIH